MAQTLQGKNEVWKTLLIITATKNKKKSDWKKKTTEMFWSILGAQLCASAPILSDTACLCIWSWHKCRLEFHTVD